MSQSDHHIVSSQTYMKILVTLLILTVITVAASRVDFGFMNTVVAMLIATVKATFVLAVFMHLKYDNLINRAIFGTGIFFLLVLFVFSITDIFTRYSQTPQ
ncbi:MAG TPA: cytochrome C oxidase subunit IV family protein [Bdellovibrionales bacterium]|nr:cytochrome C oxidase subunit IV family protein [Bdellovibrionales bacterium]